MRSALQDSRLESFARQQFVHHAEAKRVACWVDGRSQEKLARLGMGKPEADDLESDLREGRTNGYLVKADAVVAIEPGRASQARTRISPPAMAWPLTMAIVGFGSVSSRTCAFR